jgi:hypothetical protein
MEEDVKKVPFSVRLPEHLVERLKTDAQKVGLGTSDWVTSLLDVHRNDSLEKVSNESFDQENTSLRSEIESLRAEIRAGLTVPAVSPPPDLSPVLEAIKDLSCRIEAMESRPVPGSSPPVDLTPLISRLDEIMDQANPAGAPDPDSEAHALSFLSLQMGEIVQGIERLAGQMDAVVRAGKNNGGEISPEIKDELIRLAESVERQSALTGEILRIGDTVREIRERLLKNVPQGQTEVPVVPKKISRKEVRSIEPDPAAEKKRETRQWGWAVGILLVFMMGFMGWEMLGWYNGGDSSAPSAISSPKPSPGISSPGALKQAH